MSKKEKKRDYVCRDCGAGRSPSADAEDFGRVLCYQCGGTCDPTARTIERRERKYLVRAGLPNYNQTYTPPHLRGGDD